MSNRLQIKGIVLNFNLTNENYNLVNRVDTFNLTVHVDVERRALAVLLVPAVFLAASALYLYIPIKQFYSSFIQRD